MAIGFPIVPTLPSASAIFGASLPNIPSLPTIPLPGIPPIRTFPGAAQIVGSIQGNVLTVTQGIDSIAPGLSLSGVGLDPGTLIAGPLQSIQGGIGTALLNVQGSVSSIAMQAVGSINLGSLGGSLGDISSLLSGDAGDLLDGLDGPSGGDVPGWGIFLDGSPVIVPDSITAVEFKSDWHISDFPVEDGGFQSYNKVRLPFDARVTMVKGGTAAERSDFLSQVEQAAGSLDLYTVVTPEVQYADANIVHFDYSRKSTNGVTLLTVAIWLQEVRVEAVATFTNTKSPSAADQVNTGAVQTQEPTPAEVQPSPTLKAEASPDPPVPPAPPAQSATALAALPSGYSQDPVTGLVRDSSGKVDRDLSTQVGGSYVGPKTPIDQIPHANDHGYDHYADIGN